MPEPIGRGQRYMPGLDGLRAVAVVAVVIYHLGAGWLPGGLLGVGVFFTLSGYLITDLLLGEWRGQGRLQLKDFWLRRARRLLPALFLMLAVVIIWVAIGDHSQLGVLRGDALSAAFYVNNWWLVVHHVSYFARFGPPSPLGHLWSLAVEEQFYLLWPWVLLVGVLWAGRRRPGVHARGVFRRVVPRRGLLFVIVVVAALLSAAEMALLFHPSLDPTRVYDGTDTRAFGLLAGAALAMVWPSRGLTSDVSRSARLFLDVLGVAGLAGIAVLMWRTTQYSPFLYRGGMVLLSLATLAVLVSVTHPASRVGKVLGWGPLRWIGLISYGIYLWHYPIIVLTTPTASHALSPVRTTLQLVAVVVVAALSWRFVETPIRRGALGRLWRQLKVHRPRVAAVPGRAWAGLSVALTMVACGVAGLAGVLPIAPAGTLAAANTTGLNFGRTVASSKLIHLSTTTTTPHDPPTPAATAPTTTAPPSPTTSCTSVVHIGDSTSESLVSSDYLSPAQQLPAQYARVGVSNVELEISGARSLVETLPGQQNGEQVAQQLLSQGYHGCWVIALGTNDSANIAAGSSVDAPTRIHQMLSIIGNQPVLWVNAVSVLSSGPYANSSMASFNQALVQACSQFPNLRVYDWASTVQPSWFISDGIHYNSTGSAIRAASFANALAEAFPAKGQGSSSCVVH